MLSLRRYATVKAGLGEMDRLRRGMRDLAAISALPAVWVNYDPIRVAEELAGALVHMLDLRLAYVRLAARPGRPQHEVVRTAQAAAHSDEVRAIAEQLASRLNESLRTAQAIPNLLGSGELRLIVFPLGQDGEPGLLATASERPDFPTEQERLLIGVGANQATVVIQRTHAEEQLQRQTAWFRTTLSSIGDAVIATDVDGRVIFMNRVAQSLSGWTQDEAVGQALESVFRIVNERTRQPVDNPAARALSARAALSGWPITPS